MKKKFAPYMSSLFKRRTKWFTITISVLLLGVFFFLITMDNVHTETYDIERFDRAKQTIRSPITIQNDQETERKIQETIQAVEDRYTISEEVTEERIEYVEELFDALDKIDEEAEEIKKKNKKDTPSEPFDYVLEVKQIVSAEIANSISDQVILSLSQWDSEERQKRMNIFIDAVEMVMEKGVRPENKQSAISVIEESLKYSVLDEDEQKLMMELTSFAVVENSFFDPAKTEEARKTSANSVDPVVIRAGEIIVRQGQTITNEIYEDLKLVGVLDNERNFFPVIGLAIFILILCGFIFYEIYWLDKRQRQDHRTILSILFISVIVIALMKVVSLFTTQVNEFFYIVPVATGVLLLKQLIHDRLAIVMAIVYALIGSFIFNGEIPGSLNVEAGIYFLLSQMNALLLLSNVKDRLSIVRAGIGMALMNIAIILVFVFLTFEKYVLLDVLIHTSYGLASALLSAVLTLGLLPFFETGLGILSDIRLLSLSNPNQPLLRKLLVETPGTYHHSIMVANLSETACEAIGANGLLARVGAYYHDIGKTVKPHYFIENQLSITNPHDLLEPRESAEIIINHPYDGADMLRKQRIPKEIVDIAMQHHGTTLLKFFYFKEKEHDPNVKEIDFRYPGPKPQTKEAAIICICDSVEAAVRSLKEPTEEKIDEIVSSIINDRLMDGQLDECPLTLKELKSIRLAICETLKGIFHSRIQYPTKEEK
ncbi:MAG TPA: HD family phosphohydrolase [Bacillota bacterium]|nr:HD family phosphohydrolase [Bacillota bacterium]